jgi:uncharacterized protein YsxB (DUF464 family)
MGTDEQTGRQRQTTIKKLIVALENIEKTAKNYVKVNIV